MDILLKLYQQFDTELQLGIKHIYMDMSIPKYTWK